MPIYLVVERDELGYTSYLSNIIGIAKVETLKLGLVERRSPNHAYGFTGQARAKRIQVLLSFPIRTSSSCEQSARPNLTKYMRVFLLSTSETGRPGFRSGFWETGIWAGRPNIARNLDVNGKVARAMHSH